MNNLKELIDEIEHKNKSKIEMVDIFGEVDIDSAKFYLGFMLRSGDYEEVCMAGIEGERLSCEDDEIMYMYDCFASKYEKLITYNYDFVCKVMECYDI